MQSFTRLSLTGSLPISLIWKQPKFGADYYELVDSSAGDTIYATLSWPKWLSDRAIARSAVGTWYFDRLGWLRSTIVANQPARPSASSTQESRPGANRIASFEIGWFGEGDLILSSSKVFHWYRTKAFRNAWAITEVIPEDHPEPDGEFRPSGETDAQEKSPTTQHKRNNIRIGRRSKPRRRERLVYEIEFGMHWFKQEAWITLLSAKAANGSELTFLLCAGMYLGYCFNQDAAGAVAASSTVAVF